MDESPGAIRMAAGIFNVVVCSILLVVSVVLTFTLSPLAAIVAIFALVLEYRFVRGLVADVRARRDSRARRVG